MAAPTVAEAFVVSVDNSPGWVTVTYQLSKTNHTTRDGALEVARLDEEAALGVSFAYPGAFRARLRANNGGQVVEATPPGADGVFHNLSDGEYLLEVEKDPNAKFQPYVNDAMAQRMRDMGAPAADEEEDVDAMAERLRASMGAAEPEEEDDDAFDTALAARLAAMAASAHDAGCDDGVVEPSVEASMPPLVHELSDGVGVGALRDRWSRIPGLVTVTYDVEEGEVSTSDGVLSMREIDDDMAISFAFSGAFRARLRSSEFGHVLEAAPPGLDGVFEGVFRGAYTLKIDDGPEVTVAESVAYVVPAVEETGDVLYS